MSLKLYSHPLASFCWKALIALYENDTPFEPILVDFGDAASSARFRAVWPIAKMPVLRDAARGRTIAESTIIIEYLDTYHPGRTRFVPRDADEAWRTRMWDRFYDHYVHHPMQKIVTDRLRPAGANDAHGVAAARDQLADAYATIETQIGGKVWAMGDAFSLADCAAAPALYYADKVAPLGDAHRNVAAYLGRLRERPAFARTLAEAEPYFKLIPRDPDAAG